MSKESKDVVLHQVSYSVEEINETLNFLRMCQSSINIGTIKFESEDARDFQNERLVHHIKKLKESIK